MERRRDPRPSSTRAARRMSAEPFGSSGGAGRRCFLAPRRRGLAADVREALPSVVARFTGLPRAAVVGPPFDGGSQFGAPRNIGDPFTGLPVDRLQPLTSPHRLKPFIEKPDESGSMDLGGDPINPPFN